MDKDLIYSATQWMNESNSGNVVNESSEVNIKKDGQPNSNKMSDNNIINQQ